MASGGAFSGTGLHADLGVLYAPSGEDKTREFFREKTGRDASELDYHFIPVLFKLGFQF